jgi:hypothetical protein
MFQEQRPTSVTVIGWAWIVMGTLMGISAVFTLVGLVVWQDMGLTSDAMPLIFRLMPALAVLEGVVAAVGVVGGVGFLRLQARARLVLEVLTWLTLVAVIGFMVVWLVGWFSMSSSPTPDSFTILGGVMGGMITFLYGAPLVAMLVALRGPKVAAAMR